MNSAIVFLVRGVPRASDVCYFVTIILKPSPIIFSVPIFEVWDEETSQWTWMFILSIFGQHGDNMVAQRNLSTVRREMCQSLCINFQFLMLR